MDRRGFGASGDAAGYAIQREFEDVAAVVAAVADRMGGPAALWGHSYGAGCAIGGTALTNKVRQLVLYDPGFGIAYPAGSIEAIEEAMAAGDRETAILAVLIGIVGMTEEEVDALRSSPRWPTLLAGTPTMPRECRAEDGWGLPAWPARQHHGPDTPAGGLREPSPADQGNATGSGRDPRCPTPIA
jgi:pimeloyl-ACP methyl ester carboxylesterase